MVLSDNESFMERALRVTLAAVTASRCSIEEFSISFGLNGYPVSPTNLALPEVCPNQLRSGLNSVRTVLLTLNPHSGGRAESWAKYLTEFITLFPALERLGLFFHPSDFPRNKLRGFRATCEALRLEHLRVLEVKGVECSEDELARLVLNHKKTLREISFEGVCIAAGRGTWKSVMIWIRDHLSVEKLKLVNCKEARTSLVALDGDDNTISRRVEFSGDNQALTKVIESVMVESV